MKSFKEYSDYDIIIVIGGFYKLLNYKIMKDYNITYIFCNHNSIDFTGLIALLELYYENNNEHYLYLHDTCSIGDNFYNKIKSINLVNVTSIKINKNFSMNIGIYSQSIINNFKLFLLSQKNMDKNNCIIFKKSGVKNEDYIFKHDRNNILLDNYDGNLHSLPIDYYKTGTMRIVEYYPNIDLYKIKANWTELMDYTLLN
jgi:hypothetical protein